MAKLLRMAMIVGAIASLSPVQDDTAFSVVGKSLTAVNRGAAPASGRSLTDSVTDLAQTASRMSKEISNLDPQTRKLMLDFAASGIGRPESAPPKPKAGER